MKLHDNGSIEIEKLIATTDLPLICPCCGTGNECVTGSGTPRAGALLICASCRAIAVYVDAAHGLRKLTDGEWLAFTPEVRTALTSMQQFLGKRQ